MAETIGLRAVLDVSQFNKGLGQYTKGIALMNKRTTQATKGATSSFAKAGAAFVAVGVLAGSAAVAGLIAFGKAAIKEGRAFTQAMSGVAAISGAVGKEFEALEEQAKQLGRTTKFTGVEAAAGMKFLAQAGFETVDILSAMPGTLNLAAAANLGLGKSADIVSNVLKGFGKEADQTGIFVDVLTNTFTTSNTDLLQLGSAMKNVAPVAAKLGFSVEETAAAIGKMGDAGIQGGRAGTQLKNALLNLAAPSAQQAALMKELGIEIFDASGKMKTLPEVIGEVNGGLAGLGEQQQIAAIKTLAGKRAIAGFQVLLNEGQGELERYTKEVSKIGTASEIADKQLDNLEGDITLLNSAFSGFKLGTFENMEPTLRGATKGLTAFLNQMSQAEEIAKAAVEAGQGGMFERAFYSEATQGWLNVKEGVEEVIPTIQELKEANVRAALEAGKSYGPYQRQVELIVGPIEEVTKTTFELIRANQEFQGVVEQVTIANEAELKGLGDIAQQSVATTGALGSLLSITSELATVETDATQQAVELSRNRSFLVTESDRLATVTAQIARETKVYEQSQIDAAAAEEARQQTVISLRSIEGAFFSGLQEGQSAAIESEREFNSSISNIRTSAAEAQAGAAASANDKLVGLEEKRAAEEHRILTGAHARTTEINDSLLAANNAHFGELAAAESASLTERQAQIEADFATREGQAQAARAKEVAAQQAHLEELKLNAALATLESTGQLAQFTGGLTISANEAAELIRSGVIPVTNELGAAIQGTLTELGAKEGEVTAQLASNQAILQEAFAGTLEPIEAQALALGTGIPAAAVAAQTATGLANADIIAGAQNAALASQEQDLALQNLGTTTFPTLGLAAQTATQTMNEAFTTAATPIGEIDLTLNNMAILTLPLLRDTLLEVTTAMIAQLLLLLQTGIIPIDLALSFLYTTTLPALQSTTIAVSSSNISALTPVQTLIVDITAKTNALTAATVAWGVAAMTAGEDAAKGFEKAANKLTSKLVPAMNKALSVAQALATALTDVANAASSAGDTTASATGTGFAQGIGFQAGTPSNTGGALGLGFKIPSGFPNDSFGPMFAQSGEEMLITPRGMSIEGLIFSRLANLLRGTAVQGGSITNNIVNNFQMNVQTSSTPQAVTRQFEVMRGFIGT